MDMGVALAGTATVLFAGVLAAHVRLHRPGRYGVGVAAALALDLWLWDWALDPVFGHHRGLVSLLTVVNAVVAFGAVHELTGFGLHSDNPTGGPRPSMYRSPDEDLRTRGFADGEAGSSWR